MTDLELLGELINGLDKINSMLDFFNAQKKNIKNLGISSNVLNHKYEIYHMCIIRLKERKEKQKQLIINFINKL